jgi:hypothetical protein
VIDNITKSDCATDVEALLFAEGNPVQLENPFDVEDVRCNSVAAFEHGDEVCASCKESAIFFQLLLDGQKLPQARGFVISEFRKSHGIHGRCPSQSYRLRMELEPEKRDPFFEPSGTRRKVHGTRKEESKIFNLDGFVKSRKTPYFVIPAKAGIQSF